MKTPSLVVRYISHRAIPFIQLYALYVLGHGEDGPGGGFQGGVIFASSFVLTVLAFGYERGKREAPQKVMDMLAPSGALLYAGIGTVAFALGGAFLGYEAFVAADADAHTKHLAHHFGLIGIEVGVMITVSAAMVILFMEIARPDDPEERKADHAPEMGGDAPAAGSESDAQSDDAAPTEAEGGSDG